MADYTGTAWVDDPGSGSSGTIINATRMNGMEAGIKDAAEHNKAGTLASRPAAATGNKGWLYFATDTGQVFRSDGSAWTEIASPNTELGYAAITSTFTRTGVGTSDVTGLSIAVTVGARPIEVIFDGTLQNSAAAGLTLLDINEGATLLKRTALGPTAAGAQFPVRTGVRLSPSAGSHTYKIVLSQFTSGNSVIPASTSQIAYITAVQR